MGKGSGMTPLSPATIRESFGVLRDIVNASDHPEAVELVDMFERRLILDESLLAMQDRIDQATAKLMGGGQVIPFPNYGHSVKVPDPDGQYAWRADGGTA